MVKQKLESWILEDIRKIPNYFITKLQVNIHANTSVVSDFFCQTENTDYFIEAKEIKAIKPHKNCQFFSLNRITQEFKLVEYENMFKRNKSFVVFCFKNQIKNKSVIYCVPISNWIRFRNSWKKSFVLDYEFEEEFKEYKIKFDDGRFKYETIIK